MGIGCQCIFICYVKLICNSQFFLYLIIVFFSRQLGHRIDNEVLYNVLLLLFLLFFLICIKQMENLLLYIMRNIARCSWKYCSLLCDYKFEVGFRSYCSNVESGFCDLNTQTTFMVYVWTIGCDCWKCNFPTIGFPQSLLIFF